MDTLVQLSLSVQSQFLLLRASLQACMAHLIRPVPRESQAAHMRLTDAEVWRRRPCSTCLQGWVSTVPRRRARTRRAVRWVDRLCFPLRHGGLGLDMQSDEVSDAAFVAGAGQAERNLKGRPASLYPLQGAVGAFMREQWRSLHARFSQHSFGEMVRYAEQCKWDAAAKGPPTEFLDSENGLLGVQQLVRRKGDDACHADMLSSFDLDTTQGQRNAARLRSSSGGPAGAFLTAIPGGRMTLGNDMFVVSGWHRLGHHVPADVAPPPCKCSAGVAAEADHAMVCEKVAKMTQMRHDNLANDLRLVVSACSCQSAAEPHYRALAGKKDMAECQRRGDIVVVLPWLALAAVAVVVAHLSAKTYAAQGAKDTGWTVVRAERTKRTRFTKDVPDQAAFRFLPFAVETCGYMGKGAVKFVIRLGDIAAESGRIPKGAFVRWAMKLLPVTVQRGNDVPPEWAGHLALAGFAL